MIAGLIALLAAIPQPGEIRTFKDWTVGCDNVRSCHATSLMPVDGDWERAVFMSIKRGGEANAEPVIALVDDGKPSHLLVSGHATRFRLVASGDQLIVDPRDSAAAIKAFQSADAATLLGPDGASSSISLAGLNAALLYLDDRQGRVGTATALQRPGAKPVNTPPPPELPKVTSRSRNLPPPVRLNETEIDRLRGTYECVAEDPDWPGYGSEQLPLDGHRGLLLLGCGAGAYNYTSVPFIFWPEDGKTRIEPAPFDLPPRWTEEDAVASLVNASWDPDEGVLTSFAKGRGIGDCGIGSDYVWDGERFRLAHQIEMAACRGSLDYIVTWRAEVVRP